MLIPGFGEYVFYRQALAAVSRGGASQSNEAAILGKLVGSIDAPHSFCEFGFNPKQFNCVDLLRAGHAGLLIDADRLRTKTATKLFANLGLSKTTVWNRFLSLDNLREIEAFFPVDSLGVLSIDVDGNDYWFLERLLGLRPYIVVVEYNASFGNENISVPYDAAFDRHRKHPSGWYHGASIRALTGLSKRAGYALVEVSTDGINLFFVRQDVMPRHLVELDPKSAYKENTLRNAWSGTHSAEQWQQIRHLPFVELDSPG